MNIETLLGHKLEDLRKMTEIDLTNHLQHYFIVTRPELAKKQTRQVISPSRNTESQMKIQRAREMAKLVGIDLNF